MRRGPRGALAPLSQCQPGLEPTAIGIGWHSITRAAQVVSQPQANQGFQMRPGADGRADAGVAVDARLLVSLCNLLDRP